MTISIISIQSQVAFGHVGNSAAVLPMLLAGLDVAAVPTTLLSNHPRYPTVRGKVLDPELVAGLLQGIEERGLVESARYIVTGYLGSAENAAVVADFVERALRRNPGLRYVCDPVIGDSETGIFVRPGVAETIAGRLMPLASVLKPNVFEFGHLTGAPVTDVDAMLAARPEAQVVVTGCVLADTPADSLENIVLDRGRATRIPTPMLPTKSVGTGDLFTGILTAKLAQGVGIVEAAQVATLALRAVLEDTIAAGEPHLQLGHSIGALIGTMRGEA